MYLVFCVVQHMRGDKVSFTKQTRRYRGSVGDTAANLHTLGWGWGGLDWLFLATQNSKSQVLPKFSFAVGVGEGESGSFAKNRVFLAKRAKNSPSPS